MVNNSADIRAIFVSPWRSTKVRTHNFSPPGSQGLLRRSVYPPNGAEAANGTSAEPTLISSRGAATQIGASRGNINFRRHYTPTRNLGDNCHVIMDIVVPDQFKVLWVQNDDRPIVKYPNDVLRKKAHRIDRVTKKTREMMDRMERIMKDAFGVGLAAPQIGVLERVIVFKPAGQKAIALANPEITFSEGTAIGEEGCLSLPGLYGDVERAAKIEVKGLDRDNKPVKFRFEGFTARVVLHEIDHLEGVLFIDKVDQSTLHWQQPTGEDAE